MKKALSIEAKARIARYIILCCCLLAWEILPRAGLIHHLFLPPLSESLMTLKTDFAIFAEHLAVTMREIGIALVFACGGGTFFGLLLGSSLKVGKALLPVVSALFAVPLVVLYPLFTAWFGIGSLSKIVFASVYGFLPTLLGAAAGVQTIDRQLTRAASSMGATRFQEMIWVLVPASIPTILSSFRLGGALVIVGVIVAEMITSSAGIGFLLSKYRTQFDSAGVYATIIIILALAVCFDMAVQIVEKRWRSAGRSKSKTAT